MTDRILLVTGAAGMDREIMRALEKKIAGEIIVIKSDAPDTRLSLADLGIFRGPVETFHPKYGPDPRIERRRLEGKRRHR